jgi:uncharacterized membrane protein YccC
MSDTIEEGLREKQATLETFGAMAAMQQRSRLIAQQQETRAEMERHTRALQEQNRIEQDRARTEGQRLEIERSRLRAEEADRELRRLQAEQVRQLRNLMADLDADLTRFRQAHLTP